jgi:hypothetical protein
MSLTERQAGERINRALVDIRETAFLESEERRLALVQVFAQIANEFKRLSSRAGREGRPLDPVELARLRGYVRAAIQAQSDVIRERGLESEAFVDFVIASLLATHVGIVVENNGVEAGRAARDIFYDRVRRVPFNVQDAVRRLRRNDLSIPQLASAYASDATTAAEQLLLSSSLIDTPADEVSNDLFLLLLGQDIEYERYDVRREEMTPLRGLAMLGATVVVAETFNTMREGDARALAALGLARTGRWTLSARHSGLRSSPDICDDIASRNSGFGPGRYAIDRWPGSPHPYCGCFMSDVQLSNYGGWLANLR